MAKKGKGKKGKGKAKKVEPELNRKYCTEKVTSLNIKLANLRKFLNKAEHKSLELKEQLIVIEDDRSEIAELLTKELGRVRNQITEIEIRIKEITDLRQLESEQFKQTIAQLEAHYKRTLNNLHAELEMLIYKLYSLDRQDLDYKAILSLLEQQSQEVEEQGERHTMELFEAEKRGIVSKNAIQNEIVEQIKKIANDYKLACDIRQSSGRKLLEINSKLQTKRVKKVRNNLKHYEKQTFMQERYQEKLLEVELAHDRVKTLKFQSKHRKTILKDLSTSYYALRTKYVNTNAYQKGYLEAVEKTKADREAASNLKSEQNKIKTKIAICKIKNRELLEENYNNQINIVFMRKILTAFKKRIEFFLDAVVKTKESETMDKTAKSDYVAYKFLLMVDFIELLAQNIGTFNCEDTGPLIESLNKFMPENWLLNDPSKYEKTENVIGFTVEEENNEVKPKKRSSFNDVEDIAGETLKMPSLNLSADTLFSETYYKLANKVSSSESEGNPPALPRLTKELIVMDYGNVSGRMLRQLEE